MLEIGLTESALSSRKMGVRSVAEPGEKSWGIEQLKILTEFVYKIDTFLAQKTLKQF